MQRRQVLRAGCLLGLTALTGCLGDDESPFATEGDDDVPLTDDPVDLLLTTDHIEDVIGEEWTPTTGIDDQPLMFSDADIVREFFPFDPDDAHPEGDRIMSGVWYLDDVDSARESYEDSPYQWGHGLDDQPIAVESIGGMIEVYNGFAEPWGYLLFRDANVIGAVSYRNLDAEDSQVVQTSLELAMSKHESWR